MDAVLEVTVGATSPGQKTVVTDALRGAYAITGTRFALNRLRSLIDAALENGSASDSLAEAGGVPCSVQVRVRAELLAIAPAPPSREPERRQAEPAIERTFAAHPVPALPRRSDGKSTVTTRVRLEAALDAVHGRALARKLRTAKHVAKADLAAAAGIEAAAEVELGMLYREAALIDNAMQMLGITDEAVTMDAVLECGRVRFLPSRLIAFWPGKEVA